MPITSPARRSTAPATVKLHVERIKVLAELGGFGAVEAMAEQFGITRQQTYRLLDGTYLPSLPTARRMALALKVSIEELIIDGSAS